MKKKTLFKNINTGCIGCIILGSVRFVFISLEQHLSEDSIVLLLYRKKQNKNLAYCLPKCISRGFNFVNIIILSSSFESVA